MNTSRFAIAALACGLGLAAGVPYAQPPSQPEGEPTKDSDYAMFRPQRVVVFKDGYALFAKEARATVS